MSSFRMPRFTKYLLSFIFGAAFVYNLKFKFVPKTSKLVQEFRRIDPFIVRPNNLEEQIRSLPDLTELHWPPLQLAKLPTGRKDENGKPYPLPPAYEPVMSKGQRNVIEHLLEVFSSEMFRHGYGDRFMLHGGTVIGSFRHHDFIPWDDDVDLLVDERIRSEVERILKKLEPRYLFVKQTGRDKFYTVLLDEAKQDTDYELSRRVSKYRWGWPYLDIHFFSSNDTHIYEISASYGRRKTFPVKVIFPLQFRPLGQNWYPAPHDILKYLQLAFGSGEVCVLPGYSHVLEAGGPSGRNPCKSFAYRYAFVEHQPSKRLFSSEQAYRTEDKMVFSEERLVIKTSPYTSHVYHVLELPVPEHTTRAKTFGFGHREA